VAVITISPDQITKKKRRGPKGHAVDLEALKEVQALLIDESRQRDLLIEHLHKIQDQYQHISAKHLVALAHEMKLSPAEVYEVASFYHHFDITKEGQNPPPALTIRVCESLSCSMAGSNDLIEALEQGLTTDDVRIQKVPCVGRCQHAPVAVVGQNPIDEAKPEAVILAIANKNIKAPITNYISHEAYIADNGYQTLKAVIEGSMDTESIMKKMEDSGLRGLGGAGYFI